MSNRSLAIIIGGSVGAALGTTAAWFYMNAQEDKLAPSSLKDASCVCRLAHPSMLVAVTILALMKQVTDLFKLL